MASFFFNRKGRKGVAKVAEFFPCACHACPVALAYQGSEAYRGLCIKTWRSLRFLSSVYIFIIFILKVISNRYNHARVCLKSVMGVSICILL